MTASNIAAAINAAHDGGAPLAEIVRYADHVVRITAKVVALMREPAGDPT